MEVSMYFLTKDLIDSFMAETYEEFPRFKIIDKEKCLEIKGIIPGFEKENLDVELLDNILIIKGNSNQNNEFFINKFEKKFNLDSKKLDTEKIECNLRNGILTITLFRKENKKFYNKIAIA